MGQAKTGIAVYRFSTEGLPEKDRLKRWRCVIGETLAEAEFEAIPGSPFSQAASIHASPRLSLAAGGGSGYRVRRTAAHIAAGGGGDFYMHILVAGRTLVSQSGREQQISSGEGILLSGADPASKLNPGPVQYINIKVPGEILRGFATNPEAALMRPVPRDNEALRLLKEYLWAANQGAPLMPGQDSSPALVSAFTAHIHSLVALSLGAVRDVAQEAASLGLRAARLHEIKAYITRNLSRPTLSVPEVAEQHGVTPRYVQMLFAAEGVTFSEFVLSQRLVHAQRMLSEPVSAGRSISAIAFEAGFADLSYFNRAFRRRFGTTPSDVRYSAMGRAAKG